LDIDEKCINECSFLKIFFFAVIIRTATPLLRAFTLKEETNRLTVILTVNAIIWMHTKTSNPFLHH
tara:strand:- start:3223 stop:3420 length:198 start_codon:yes stop_codon:yes gene_type:complete